MPASIARIACIAIYARFQRQNGEWLPKLVPSESSQPRAKLLAILLNKYATETVKHEFGNKYKKISNLKLAKLCLIG